MTMNLSKLWDYSKPDLSEQRFREALSAASADERFILQTQIARSYGIRCDFAHAHQLLTEIEPQLPQVSLEAKVRYYLELY